MHSRRTLSVAPALTAGLLLALIAAVEAATPWAGTYTVTNTPCNPGCCCQAVSQSASVTQNGNSITLVMPTTGGAVCGNQNSASFPLTLSSTNDQLATGTNPFVGSGPVNATWSNGLVVLSGLNASNGLCQAQFQCSAGACASGASTSTSSTTAAPSTTTTASTNPPGTSTPGGSTSTRTSSANSSVPLTGWLVAAVVLLQWCVLRSTQ